MKYIKNIPFGKDKFEFLNKSSLALQRPYNALRIYKQIMKPIQGGCKINLYDYCSSFSAN